MYWIYDIPPGLLGLLFMVAFIGFAAAGVFLAHRVRPSFVKEVGWAEHVGTVLEGAFVFFGLLLALVIIAAYDNFTTAREDVAGEASELGSLYRAVSSYPEPIRGQLQADLREYTEFVIDKAWPLQRQGIVPTGGVPLVSKFQDKLASFEPKTNGEIALHGATLFKFNDFVKARRERLHFVTVGLPGVLWEVLIFGALLTVALTWLLPVERVKAHLIVSGASGLIVGMLLFVTAALDNPFRGDLSISPEAFEVIAHDIMGVTTAGH
jgi:hypothetical protein